MYQKIMPPYIPAPKAMVFWSGVAEIILGSALFFPTIKDIALWNIIIMLVIFFSVHIHMLQDDKIRSKFPLWLLWFRIPLQFLLIYWSYSYLNL
ncbi:hypothetical protein SAMN05216480_101745 [Pustulibacterium marinum]|uniref:DoxX-like family protein n=2 Tax=Pustulibacterium marinum TaxID=1224947 RepID=A0A1I7F8M0_9FLAO|nr:hypothetical protein SAMN05216480_101745 [Pustulibacterium marinum]